MDAYIHRHIEHIIPQILQTFPSLIITGPRQVGKTTLLTHCIPDNYSYVTLDDLVTRSIAQEDPALFFVNNRGNLIIDEVQYAPDLFPYIKMNIDKSGDNGLYLLSGSQKYALMGKVRESLAGRIAILELQGYSLREIMGKSFFTPFIPNSNYIEARTQFESDYSKSADSSTSSPFPEETPAEGLSLWQAIQRGLLPRTLTPAIDWNLYLSAYVQTYIERDVRQLAHIGDEMQFRQFLVAMAARTGELLNYSNISRDVGISVDTVKRWTSILQASGLIVLIQPYANNALSRTIKSPKLYFFDTGLVSYLTGWTTPEVLQRGAKAGNLFETFVVSEIAKSWMNAGRSLDNLFYYRDKEGNEIDLIINQDGTLYPIEIKMTATPKVSMTKAFQKLDSIPGMKRGQGALICQRSEPTYLATDLISLPVSFL